MTTITIDSDTRTQLLQIAAGLQLKSNKKLDYNDAIKFLISIYQEKRKDPEKFKSACSTISGINSEELLEALLIERRKDETRYTLK